MRRVAIIGGGPSGTALANFLGKSGVKSVVFSKPNRPDLLIGESLVPAVEAE